MIQQEQEKMKTHASPNENTCVKSRCDGPFAFLRLAVFVCSVALLANAIGLSRLSAQQDLPAETQATDETDSQPRDQIESSEPDPEDLDPSVTRSWRQLERASEPVRKAFREVVSDASAATVQIFADDKGSDKDSDRKSDDQSNRKMVAMGTIVSSDGLVLTKASEMRTNPICHLPDGRELPARVFGIHTETDLALLKIEASGLQSIRWNEGESVLPVGSWLVTPDIEAIPLAAGVVSVKARKVSPSGVLGVYLDQDKRGVRIDRVVGSSPAEAANMLVNDIVIGVNDKEIRTREEMMTELKQFSPGDEVEITVLRGGMRMVLRPVLGLRSIIDAELEDARSNIQNRMGSPLSQRRTGFAAVIQHDTMLAPNQCGGVVVDIDGRAVGVNIARSGRIMSYALPAATVLPILSQLTGGELSPQVVNKPRLELIAARMKELNEEEAELPIKRDRLEKEVDKLGSSIDSLKESIEAARKQLEEATNQLAKTENERSDLARELRAAKRKLRRIESTRVKLREEREALQLGTFPESDQN